MDVNAEIVVDRKALDINRSDITVVDKLARAACTVAKNDTVAGSLTAVEHTVVVLAGNTHGGSGPSTGVTVTPTVDKSADITIARVTGAEHYDVFVGTGGSALWLARVQDTEVVSGAIVAADGTVTTEGATAGKVTVKGVGTGQASSATKLANNTAYTPESVEGTNVSASGVACVEGFMSLTGLGADPKLVLIPWLQNADGQWTHGALQDLTPLTSGCGLGQQFFVTVNAASRLSILVDDIAGTGATVDIKVTPV